MLTIFVVTFYNFPVRTHHRSGNIFPLSPAAAHTAEVWSLNFGGTVYNVGEDRREGEKSETIAVKMTRTKVETLNARSGNTAFARRRCDKLFARVHLGV